MLAEGAQRPWLIVHLKSCKSEKCPQALAEVCCLAVPGGGFAFSVWLAALSGEQKLESM
jgi:hypothetical protein